VTFIVIAVVALCLGGYVGVTFIASNAVQKIGTTAEPAPLPSGGPVLTYPPAQEAAHPNASVPARPDNLGWTVTPLGIAVGATGSAIYEAGASTLVAHEPLGGAVVWRTSVAPVQVDSVLNVGRLLLAVGTMGQSSGATSRTATAMLDPSNGGLLGRVAGRPVATNQDESTIVTDDFDASGCSCETVYGVSLATRQPVWSMRSDPHETLVATRAGQPWFGFLAVGSGKVRPLDPASGAVRTTYTLPVGVDPAGFQFSDWIIESPASSIYVATDLGVGTTIVSGINPTTGVALWSSRLKITPLTGGDAVSASRCGDLVCLADADGVFVVDPAGGHMAQLRAATRVLTDGTTWAAEYAVPGAGTSVIDGVAFLDPRTFEPGPVTVFLTPIGFVAGKIVGLRYLTGTELAQDAQSGSDTAIITMDTNGDQAVASRLAGTHWDCIPAVIRVACVSASPLTLRVVPAI
jgi:hypothetical protein